MKWNAEPLRTVEQLRDALDESPAETAVGFESSRHVMNKASLLNRRPWKTLEGKITLREQ